MSDIKIKAQVFLSDYKMTAADINAETVLHDFASEMGAGLTGDESSLAMIASYINADAAVPANKPVIVLDAGGTNLRVCTVSFDTQGNAEIAHFANYQMPGIAHELTRQEFYNRLCEYLQPVINMSDAIGFCFSYPSEISPNKDGKLLFWTKEIKVPEVVGEYIGAGLLDALAQRGHTGKKIVLLNDTVSCLLAGKAVGEQRQYDGYIGFILGTGTNTAYIEDNHNIGKLDVQAGTQVINVESGNFAKFPQGDIDKIYDAGTNNPGKQTFEKMISGRYLGDITLEVIKQGARDGLFSTTAVALIDGMKSLETAELSLFIENPFSAQAPFNDAMIEAADRELIYYIVIELIERAAKLAAINMAAAAIKAGKGHSPVHPICINVDGSTFHKLYGFRGKCEAYLTAMLNQRGIYYEIIEVQNAPVIGTAIAALVG
ncbi:MAG: hypothetical protein WBM99_10785 [Psychromonas sp.]